MDLYLSHFLALLWISYGAARRTVQHTADRALVTALYR